MRDEILLDGQKELVYVRRKPETAWERSERIACESRADWYNRCDIDGYIQSGLCREGEVCDDETGV